MDLRQDYTENRFCQLVVPYSFLFFGIALTLISLPIKQHYLIEYSVFRHMMIALGGSCVLAAVVIFYRRSVAREGGENRIGDNRDIRSTIAKANATTDQVLQMAESTGKGGVDNTVVAEEFAMCWNTRRDHLTESQLQVLKYFEKVKSARYSLVSQEFAYFGSGELFFRLEQLRLLGFIVCDSLGKPNGNPGLFVYSLSEIYALEVLRNFVNKNPAIEEKNQEKEVVSMGM